MNLKARKYQSVKQFESSQQSVSSSDAGDLDRRFRKNLLTYEKIEPFGIKFYNVPRPEKATVKTKSALITQPSKGVKMLKLTHTAEYAESKRYIPGVGSYSKVKNWKNSTSKL